LTFKLEMSSSLDKNQIFSVILKESRFGENYGY